MVGEVEKEMVGEGWVEESWVVVVETAGSAE
jgi:hypothetical protein